MLMAASLILGSCQKSLDTASHLDVPTEESRATLGPLNVYVAGQVTSASGKTLAVYWRNGQQITLTPGATTNNYATAMYMYGLDRYVAGVSDRGATYWKNDTPVYLSDKYSRATAMFVAGKDIYVAGNTNATGTTFGQYWKNGVKTVLPGGNSSDTRAITVSGRDVYVAGFAGSSVNKMIMGIYWKNLEVSTNESNGTYSSTFNAIAVNGADVYTAGWQGNGSHTVAKYIHGYEYWLTDGSQNASANSIWIVGTDVYTAGVQSNGTHMVAMYWKNYIPVSLTDGTTDATANCIVVDNDHNIWVAGTVNGANGVPSAVYWKNGVRTNLSAPGQRGAAASLFLSRS